MAFPHYRQMRFLCPWCGDRCLLSPYDEQAPYLQIWVECRSCEFLGLSLLLEYDDWRERLRQAALGIAQVIAETYDQLPTIYLYPTFDARDDLCGIEGKLLYEGDLVEGVPLADRLIKAASDEHDYFTCVVLAVAAPPVPPPPVTVYDHLLGD